MPAALVLPISGPYVGTWNSNPLGTQNDDGFVVTVQHQGQEINASDAYGMTLVEAIWRGMNWRCRLRGLEFNKTGLLTLLQMFGQSGANTTLTPQLTAIGDRWSNYAKALLLTAILGNPPTMPQTLTASSSCLAPGQTTEFMATSKMREMPIEMVLLPYSATVGSGSIVVPFTTT
jgi:hypothetical protein